MTRVAVVYSRAVMGMQALPVTIEVHLSRGLPCFKIVGLPETAVKESKERVRSALLNNQFDFPIQRVTVNLAPADLPKEGACFDLPIAIGILGASGQLTDVDFSAYEFVGELGLTGEIRSIRGALPQAIAIAKTQREFVLPKKNTAEAQLIKQARIIPAEHLCEVIAHLRKTEIIPAVQGTEPTTKLCHPDLSDVKGQQVARRALEIAAAGGHSLMLAGPPGTGKTLIARRLPGLLPALSVPKAEEIAAIYSASRQGFDAKHWRLRPFRSPHHTISAPALVGGDNPPQPGEVSLAHEGVLFLDELTEFKRHVLEVLREPLESHEVMISRAGRQATFPAQFQWVSAMNPCPCGYFGEPSGRCQCTPSEIQRYLSKLSGPLLDRVDIGLLMLPMSTQELLSETNIAAAETSACVRERVIIAHDRQLERAGKVNFELTNAEIQQYCSVKKGDQAFLHPLIEKLGLSVRAYHRILKVARTIADLAGARSIEAEHLSEAATFRRMLHDYGRRR